MDPLWEDDWKSRMPDTIGLILAAVAGGVTGNPVSLVLSGYPSDVVPGIFGVALRLVGQGKFAEIGGTADLSKFYKEIYDKRVVLLYASYRRLGIRDQVNLRIESRRNLEDRCRWCWSRTVQGLVIARQRHLSSTETS